MISNALLNPLFGDEKMQQIFSDAAFMEQMVLVERTLAAGQGQLGVIPDAAAAAIVAALDTFVPDLPQLQAGVERAGVPVPELVRQLRQHVGGEAASFVHWGATTQDVMDTAVILQIRHALNELEPALQETITNLARLADAQCHTLMVGRTHSQQALPITFGYKVAGWMAPLLRHQQRLQELKPRLLQLQFGGAVGTLAALGEKGTAVQQALAAALNLHVPTITWHTQRDTLAECAGWLSLLSGSLAKMAQDIILLAQSEVGELRETADPKRGGSSTMPQKSNPIISEGIIAIARANASLLATLHQAQIQEHERGTHGWQMEWLTLPTMFVYTAAALRKAHFLSQNLVVNEDKMRQNVAASNGLMLAEPISLALSQQLGRAAAQVLVKEACQEAFAQQRHLMEVVREKTDVLLDWEKIGSEANYLGSVQVMIDRIIASVVSEE
ncbi:MAG: 3-carboxy-cis,cis-muconate cycloisomerase [Ardenticatenaceae bacterium]|nr:3-carboxy-cis,cis-muconate cycloisomerase [Ardenticatenaceae bacterium]